MAKQVHGGDIYAIKIRRGEILDFSTTVVKEALPKAWLKQQKAALEALHYYPQPFSADLARQIEKKEKLPKGSVAVGNGSSECLQWLARSLAGKRVVLEAPCFGEYERFLKAAGAKVQAVFGQAPARPRLYQLLECLKKGDSLWLANPSSPLGHVLGKVQVDELVDACKAKGVTLVLDESLHAQALEEFYSPLQRSVRVSGCFIVRSISKGLDLAGLRLGYLVGHPSAMVKIGAFQDRWSVGSLAQRLGPKLLGVANRNKLVIELANRKNDLIDKLKQIEAVEVVASHTGFFLVWLKKPNMNADLLAERLKKQGVLVRSCSSFGPWGRRYLRLNPGNFEQNQVLYAALANALSG